MAQDFKTIFRLRFSKNHVAVLGFICVHWEIRFEKFPLRVCDILKSFTAPSLCSIHEIVWCYFSFQFFIKYSRLILETRIYDQRNSGQPLYVEIHTYQTWWLRKYPQCASFLDDKNIPAKCPAGLQPGRKLCQRGSPVTCAVSPVIVIPL